ncbi:hypothetical protein ACPA9J_25325 [Pseudomonas aeruginosa]
MTSARSGGGRAGLFIEHPGQRLLPRWHIFFCPAERAAGRDAWRRCPASMYPAARTRR